MTQREIIKRASKRNKISQTKLQECFDLIETIMKQEVDLAEENCVLKMCDLQFIVKHTKQKTIIMQTTKQEITVEPHKLLNVKFSSDWKRILRPKLRK